MKISSIIWTIIAIIIIGGGIWYFATQNSDNEAAEYKTTPQATEQNEYDTTQPAESQNGADTPSKTNSASIQTMTVTYNGSSFNPATLTIHPGDTVTFVDSSSNPMWVASGMHPTHTLYDDTDRSEHCATGYSGPPPFDECKASTASYSFTFTEVGTHPYHDHINASASGKIIVQ